MCLNCQQGAAVDANVDRFYLVLKRIAHAYQNNGTRHSQYTILLKSSSAKERILKLFSKSQCDALDLSLKLICLLCIDVPTLNKHEISIQEVYTFGMFIK